MQRLKRIALYGGTFDPVHIGHIAVAHNLLSLFALDEVLFIPAHIAPHKRRAAVTPPLHRYAMLALATQDDALMRISTIELDAPERPYTVETLTRLQLEHAEAAQLFFIMGADSWSEITTWYEWERVLGLCHHIVVARPGYELSLAHVTPAVRERIADLRGLSDDEVKRRIDESESGGRKIYVTDAVFVDASATEIRRAAGNNTGEDWRTLVPPPVADYIAKYELYKDRYGTKFDS